MAFWGIEVKPGKPFCLKYDNGVRRRLRISHATLSIGHSTLTSLVQCNVGNKSPVLLCALLPEKNDSMMLHFEFEEDEDVLFSVIGPRGVYLTGFYTGFYTGIGRNFNDDDTESFGEDIANSESKESNPQSDDYDYKDSFIDDDDSLEVLPLSPVSADGVDEDKYKQKNKANTKKRLKKKSQVVNSDDDSISWPQNTGTCIRSVFTDKQPKKRSQVVESDEDSISWKQNLENCIRVVVNDSEDDCLISSVRKGKKAAKNIVSESNGCSDASKPKPDLPNDDPNRTAPEEKGMGTSIEEKSFEADAAGHSNPEDKAKKSKSNTNDITVYQNPVVGDEIPDDQHSKKTTPKKKGKGVSDEVKIYEADAGDRSNQDHTPKKCELKTNNIAIREDPIVTNEIDVDPGTNKTTPKKKGKGVPDEVKIFEADAGDHSNPVHTDKKCELKTNNIAICQDPIVTNEIDVDPGTNKRSSLLASPDLGLKSGVKPKKKRKERSKEAKIPEENIDNHFKNSQEKKYLKADTGADDMDQDLHVGKENDRRPSNKTETGFSAGSLLPIVEEGTEKPKQKRRKREQEQKTPSDNGLVVPERKADEITYEKTAKKKKQKSKVQKIDEYADAPVLMKREKENSITEGQDENVISGSSQVRTLSNGLVIEDIESSRSNGKAAAVGRKLKVQYTAKLMESGEIIDSNGKAPYRFRLGDEGIIEGWNIGLDGMRAGDKRRLVVPPLLGNGSKGTAENVPPDSWVIYDVEVLSVR